jgi:hypothetical protein
MLVKAGSEYIWNQFISSISCIGYKNVNPNLSSETALICDSDKITNPDIIQSGETNL